MWDIDGPYDFRIKGQQTSSVHVEHAEREVRRVEVVRIHADGIGSRLSQSEGVIFKPMRMMQHHSSLWRRDGDIGDVAVPVGRIPVQILACESRERVFANIARVGNIAYDFSADRNYLAAGLRRDDVEREVAGEVNFIDDLQQILPVASKNNFGIVIGQMTVVIEDQFALRIP